MWTLYDFDREEAFSLFAEPMEKLIHERRAKV